MMLQRDAGIEDACCVVCGVPTSIASSAGVRCQASRELVRFGEPRRRMRSCAANSHAKLAASASSLSSAMARRRNGDETSAFGCRSSPPSLPRARRRCFSLNVVVSCHSLHPFLSLFFLWSACHTLHPSARHAALVPAAER